MAVVFIILDWIFVLISNHISLKNEILVIRSRILKENVRAPRHSLVA